MTMSLIVKYPEETLEPKFSRVDKTIVWVSFSEAFNNMRTHLRVPPTLGLARSKSSFWFHAIEYSRTSLSIPENRFKSVLSGRQRPLNVGKIAFRRSQFRPIRPREVETFFV